MWQWMSELCEHGSSQAICSQFGSSIITAISPKILNPHNNLCVHSDNRSHCKHQACRCSRSVITLAWFHTSLHCEAICGTNATFNTDKKVILQNCVESRPKDRLADYSTRRLEWGLVGWHWMACTQLAHRMDQSGCRNSEARRIRSTLRVCMLCCIW